MYKFFAEKNNFNNKTILIKNEDAVHIYKVLRLSIGEEIAICNGEGQNFNCIINSIDKNNKVVETTILKEIYDNTEPIIDITLFQGLPKGDKFDLIIQKNVELGVKKIVPVITENTVSKPNNFFKKLERYNKISESAAKQSKRNIIPKICDLINFNEILEQTKKFDKFFVCYENQKGNLKNNLKNNKGKNIGVFIGPEGGFSQKEIDLLIENNGICVSLGRRILRTETAGFMLLPIIFYENDEYI